MLETRQNHHPRIISEDVFGSISVMNIEVHNTDSFETEFLHGVGRCHGDRIKETKTHGQVPFRMMSGRPNGTKNMFMVSPRHPIDRIQKSPGSQKTAIPSEFVHDRVGIDRKITLRRSASLEKVPVVTRMDSQNIVL